MIIIENGTKFKVEGAKSGIVVSIIQEEKPQQIQPAKEKKYPSKKKSKAKSNEWTEEDDRFLQENMYKLSKEALVEALGRTKSSIDYRLYAKHGYSKRDNGIANLGQTQEAEVIE